MLGINGNPLEGRDYRPMSCRTRGKWSPVPRDTFHDRRPRAIRPIPVVLASTPHGRTGSGRHQLRRPLNRVRALVVLPTP